jgi:hypothetical protein
MHDHHETMEHAFFDMDQTIKILDVPAIVSLILDLPLPFVNLGVIHPAFSPTSDLMTIHRQMMNNLIQIELYVREYCEITKLTWCDHEIVDFQKSISNFQRFAFKRAPNIDLIDHIDMMYEFANEKSKYFVTLWTAFDFQAFYGGMAAGLWLVIF